MASLPTWLFPQLAPSSVFEPSATPTNPDGSTNTSVRSQNTQNNSGGNSSLYLFTFLTTLLLRMCSYSYSDGPLDSHLF